MTNLPAEIRTQLASLPEVEIKRLESLVARGITAPLTPEKEVGPFLLYIIGDSLEDVATKTGTPKDVIYLTYVKYGWAEKKNHLSSSGMDKVIEQLNKNMVHHVLVATFKVLTEQIGKVMSGEMPHEKCSYIPRSLHGVRQLIEMAEQVNNIVKDADKKPGNTIVQANNVQINQQVEAPKEEVKRISREERLARMAQDKDKK
jgi:hypothetical protein